MHFVALCDGNARKPMHIETEKYHVQGRRAQNKTEGDESEWKEKEN